MEKEDLFTLYMEKNIDAVHNIYKDVEFLSREIPNPTINYIKDALAQKYKISFKLSVWGAFFVSILKYKIYTDNIFIDFFKLFILNIMYGSLMELLMDRYTIIQTIGKDYLVSNIENNEFSYQKAFKQLNQDFMSKKITNKTGGGIL